MKPPSSKRMLFWLSLLAATLLLALAVLIVLSTLGKGMAVLLPPPTASAPALSAAPATWTPLPTWYPPAKQTYEVGLELTRAYYHTFPPPTTTPGPSPTRPPTYTPEPFVPGIYHSQAEPLPSMGYAWSDWWQGIVNGERIRVFPGARRDNPGVTNEASQGVVFVETVAMDQMNYDYELYEAPIANTGVLTITAVKDARLTLQAESGAVLYFDVATRQFVDSLSAKISAPTVTPLPTINPTLLTPSPFPALPLSATPYP